VLPQLVADLPDRRGRNTARDAGYVLPAHGFRGDPSDPPDTFQGSF
jgi:hypothetical protein